MHPVLGHFGWMVIPHGWGTSASGSPTLRVSVRVLPRLPPRDGGSTLKDYIGAAEDDRQALAAWPRYLLENRVAFTVSAGGSVGRIDVQAAWRNQLRALGFGVTGSGNLDESRVRRAERLWKGIFPDKTPVTGEAATDPGAPSTTSISPQWPHAKAATVTRRVLGNLFATSLGPLSAPIAAPAASALPAGDNGQVAGLAIVAAAGVAASLVSESRAAPAAAMLATAAVVGVSDARAADATVANAGAGTASLATAGAPPGVSELPSGAKLPPELAGFRRLYASPKPAADPAAAATAATATTAVSIAPIAGRLNVAPIGGETLAAVIPNMAARAMYEEISAWTIDRFRDAAGVDFNNLMVAAVARRSAERMLGVPTEEPAREDFLTDAVLRKSVNTRSDADIDEAELIRSRDSDPLGRDFHGVLASLTLHPTLLLALGLTIEAEVQFTPALAASPDTFDLAVSDVWIADELLVHSKLPRIQVDRESGAPRSQPGAASLGIARGALDMKDFALAQIDIDGALARLQNAVSKLQSQVDSGVPVESTRVNPGVLRTTGFSLLHRTCAEYLTERDKPKDVLYAEDLLAGFRPDIRILDVADHDQPCPRPWTEATRREVSSMKLDGEDIRSWFPRHLVDEGFVAHITRVPRVGGKLSDKFIIAQEEIVQFEPDGWNPILPRPGSPPGKTGISADGAQFSHGTFSLAYRPARARTQNRFGGGVRVGLRPVYCDGRGPKLSAALSRYDEEGGTATVGDGAEYYPILRGEPLAPPDVHLADELNRADYPRERGTRMVVATRAKGAGKDAATRYVVPPRRSLEVAILSGMYDSPEMRRALPSGAFAGIALDRHGNVPAIEPSYFDRLVGRKTEVRETVFEDAGFGDRAPEIPYLPDPAARRLIFALYRESDRALLYIDSYDYYDEGHLWPNCRPLKVVLHRATADALSGRGFDVSLKGAELTVRLAPSMTATLFLWHEADLRFLQSSMVPKLIAEFLATPDGAAIASQLPGRCKPDPAAPVVPAAPGAIPPASKDRDELIECLSGWHIGRHPEVDRAMPGGTRSREVNLSSFWMLNPSKSITLVHAVDQPLSDPRVVIAVPPEKEVAGIRELPSEFSQLQTRLRMTRKPNETSAEFSGDVTFHRPSTLRLDCLGSWTDPVDDPKLGPPTTSSADAVLWSLEAIKPYLKSIYFEPNNDAPGARKAGNSADVANDNDVLSVGGARIRQGRDDNEDLPTPLGFDFGDTRARLVQVRLHAHGRFREEFADLSGEGKVSPRQGPIVDVKVLSSRPPDRPAIDYIMPLLRWKPGNTDGTSIREGGWFRIWLNRGWYSSGYEERLAIVCWPPTTFDPRKRGEVFRWFAPAATVTPPPKVIESLVTRWGSDPLWYEEKALDSPPAWAFVNRLEGETPKVDLRRFIDPTALADTAGAIDTTASVALYAPEYDAGRGQWRVDIQFDPAGSYFPFLRLAIARYQAHSLQGLELSEIVATEFVQLLPTRSATLQIERKDEKNWKLTLTVAGILLRPDDAHDSGQRRPNDTVFVARLERRETRFFSPDDNTRNWQAGGAKDTRMGDWLPVSGQASTDRETTLGGSGDKRVGTLPFEREGGFQYSVFLEEWEPTVPYGQNPIPKGRLVYSDRLILSL